jgi:hypothetical protein
MPTKKFNLNKKRKVQKKAALKRKKIELTKPIILNSDISASAILPFANIAS